MKKYHGYFLAIILLAFALRLYNLTYHSFWFDEAVSVHWARQTTARILEVGFTLVEDRLPPLYYLTLKGWTGLVGFSETGVRSLSVFFGTLLTPVMAALAGLLFNRRIAALTALLVALNPFLIWYSQEARMYAPAVFFGALAVWAWLQLVKVKERRSASGPTSSILFSYQLLFILAAGAALYSHLYAGFLLPALGLWLIVSYPRAWGLWLRFALSGLAMTLAFAPLALAIWRFSGEAAPGQPLAGLGRRAWQLLQAFTIWEAPLVPLLQGLVPLIIVLFALAAYLPRPGGQPPPGPNRKGPSSPGGGRLPNPRLLTTLLFLTPFLIATLLLARNYLAFFGERYFIGMVPWLLLLAAAGADNLSRWMTWGLFSWSAARSRSTPLRDLAWSHTPGDAKRSPGPTGGLKTPQNVGSRPAPSALRPPLPLPLLRALPPLLLLIATALPIPGQWSGPAAKEFWRQSVAYLAETARPEDGILIHPDWVRYPFQYYFQGPGQTYAAFSQVTPETALDGPLQGVVGEHPVVWLIQSHVDSPDPHRRVEQWFAARYPLVTELYPPGIALTGYAPGYRLDRLPPEATPVDIQFENGMQLIGYQADAGAPAADDFFHPPSGWLHVTLYWTAARPVAPERRPYVHVVGPEGVWGVDLDRSNDALQLYPPSRWPPASDRQTIIRHDLDVNLNPATPAGLYQVVVGLHGEEAAARPLTTVEIR